MGAGTFDQSDRRPPAPTEAIAELRDELHPRRAAAAHHNAMQRLLARALAHTWNPFRSSRMSLWRIEIMGYAPKGCAGRAASCGYISTRCSLRESAPAQAGYGYWDRGRGRRL